MINVVVNADGMVLVINIVNFLVVVSPNLVFVKVVKKHPSVLKVNVVKNMVDVKMVNAIVDTIGAVLATNIVVQDVKVNLVPVNNLLLTKLNLKKYILLK